MNLFHRNKLKMTGSRRSALDMARGRLVFISAVFVVAYIIVAARAFDVSIIQGELRGVSEQSLFESPKRERSVRRADIVDRNGVIMARSLKTASLYADPTLIQDPVKVAEDLTKMFPDLTYGDVLQKLQSSKRFVWIKRNLTPEEHYDVLYLGYPGLNFKEEDRRIYPQGALAAHMLGYTSIDGSGLAGVEASFDKLLGSEDRSLALTLDVRIQHALRREMLSVIDEYNAKAGAGLVMDVRNGEVLAAVSLPDFDPNDFSRADKKEKFNRVSLGVYELGSTFKIFSTAALLETQNVSMSKTFDAREPLKEGRFTINDYHAQKRVMTVPEVFIHSSNIGSAMMGEMVGTDALKKFYSDIGLMEEPAFEIQEVGAPIIPSPWREINTLTASYGHGIAVSPLQLVSAASSILNGGILVKPTLILDNHNNAENQSEVRIVSPQTAHRMRQLMRMTVTDGTGKSAEVKGYNVGGKTGTAEKSSVGGYNRGKLISSFLGAFPMNAPRYVVYIMVDEPKGNASSGWYATGGWVAAPAVAKVIGSMASILGIPPEGDAEDLPDSLRRYVKTKEQIKEEKEIASH